MKFLLLLVIFFNGLFADFLHKTYYIDTKHIKISDIIDDSDDNTTIFNISENRYSKRIKSKLLLQKLIDNGYDSFKSKNSYIKFILKSPIDRSIIKNYIKQFYQENYVNMKIISVDVEPRNYIDKLEDNYTVHLNIKNKKSNDGIIYVKTDSKKKIFFNYKIDALIDVYISKYKIKRDTKITISNTSRKRIKFSKFKAIPIDIDDLNSVQSKNNIKENSIITIKDIEKLDIVEKGSSVNVSMNSKYIAISFIAKALKSGKLNDTITVQKSNGKRFRVQIIGKNRVEIR